MFKKVTSLFLSVLLVCAVFANLGVFGFAASADECEHEYGEWSLTQYATCTEPGVEYKFCSLCGYMNTIVLEPATGHKFGDWETSVVATCNEIGEEARVCSVCNLRETRETKKLAHNFADGVCSGCSAILGDVNMDNDLDIRDLIVLKDKLLDATQVYDSLLDINIDASLNADDMVALRKILFARL